MLGWNDQLRTKVKWSGTFTQFDTDYEMHFDNMYMDINGNICGAGSDDIGDFIINGQDDGDTEVYFIKQYKGAHAVHYKGESDGSTVTGTWEIPGNCDGTFDLTIHLQGWTGWFKQGGDKNDMELNLQVDNGGVFGYGMDEIGRFVMRGYTDMTQNCVSFVKSYLGQHQVMYNGAWFKKDGKEYIKGVWTIPGNGHGWFKMKWNA